MSGKGDSRRPTAVPADQVAREWDRIFPPKPPASEWQATVKQLQSPIGPMTFISCDRVRR